jgi:hypothetical protein
MYATGDSGEIA